METQTDMTYAASQISDILQPFVSATRLHQTNLRLDINQMEAIVGCIAKSKDEEVVKYLPDANQAISNLRSCLSSLETDRQIFEFNQGRFGGA
jgi:hypothetical protein